MVSQGSAQVCYQSLFGGRLLELEPDLLESFSDFKEDSWKLTHKVLSIFCKKVNVAKRKGIDLP